MIKKYTMAFAASILMNVLMAQKSTSPQLLLVGGYTEKMGWVEGTARGIGVYEFDSNTGKLSLKTTSTYIKNPSYIAIHPLTKNVYAVSETDGDTESKGGKLVALHFNFNTLQLEQMNAVPSEGNSPCFVSIDKTGHYALVANYGNGSVATMKIEANGKINKSENIDQHKGKGPAPQQALAHAHNFLTSVNNQFAYSNDLGSDQIYVYHFDSTNGKTEAINTIISTAKGAGPRQLTFHTTLNVAYALNELNGTIDAYTVDTLTGNLQVFQTISTLTKGANLPASSAEIRISPSGKFLYASNRANHNNIAIYSINLSSGKLNLIAHHSTLGKTPRYFTIDPSGKFILIANQDSNSVVTFKLDEKTGLFIEPGIVSDVPTPTCLVFF